MDIDIIVHEEDFQKATKVFYDIGYKKVLGDNLCSRFQHEYFLSIDLFISTIYGPHPSDHNTVEYEQNITFCNLPLLILTKIKAYMGRPRTPSMKVKRLQDHVDLLNLIIIYDLNINYAKFNNYDYLAEHTYRKIYNEHYDKFKLTANKREKKSNCTCQ